MKARGSLLILSLFSMLAYGLSSVMFNDMSNEMAASAGLSLDEVEQIKVGFTITQILGFVFTPLMVRQWGSYLLLILSLAAGFGANLVLYMDLAHEWGFVLPWLCIGFSMSVLLVVVNLQLLDSFEPHWLPAMIALTLVLSTLIPMGAYPWITARVLEQFSWSLFSLVLAWLYFSALVIAYLFPPLSVKTEAQPKSGLGVYLLIASAVSLVVFLLMRGSYYNWLDSAFYSELVIIAASLSLLTVFVLLSQRTKPYTASMKLHRQLKTNVFMYNAFLAGFAVMASTALFGSFLSKVMQYNALNSGYAQLPSFYAMLAGMSLSVTVFYCRRALSDAVVPFGVALILISVYMFSQLPSDVGPESIWLPMLLRGFGVGLLNVSVTISVLLYFKPEERVEGICNFYLFRTMGGLIGGALFSRVIQNYGAQASGEIGRTLNESTHAFSAYEHALGHAILTNGNLPTPASGMGQIGDVLITQSTTLALNNALIIFIISVFVLAPVLIFGKKLSAR
ncbi:MFS transporter [Photobacterium atrarenae]|uniref:MFS transporter n=1 Tax=Photobacterium atrarenae TaxID=865757 RepID=A0ABY5GQW2_9GAMM|nr:MFS transporter [Photobacterium atrarenae]UTV31044.1 MFS transporter [Photobacterium atrarenae]